MKRLVCLCVCVPLCVHVRVGWGGVRVGWGGVRVGGGGIRVCTPLPARGCQYDMYRSVRELGAAGASEKTRRPISPPQSITPDVAARRASR